MIDKLDYLNKYRDNVELVYINDVESFITDEWKNVFNERTQSKRVENTINIWKKYCEKELKNIINYLSEHLIDVRLVKTSYGLSVIYELIMIDGSIDYYEGLLPIKDYNKELLSWNSIPESLKNFYSSIHNGFYYYAGQNMGILPVQKITCMNEYDWEIIEDLKLDIPFSMKSTYIFFETGMGGYVLLDTQKYRSENSIVWFSRRKPICNKNFWDIVDEWIVMGFN